MRHTALMIATILAILWFLVWLIWKYTLATLITVTVVAGCLYLVASVRNRGRSAGML